jgi:uncharacterized protein YjgD (DUF1641 family)
VQRPARGEKDAGGGEVSFRSLKYTVGLLHFHAKKAENILKEVFARLIQQSSRVELGKKFESGFYAKPDTPSPQAVPAAGEPTISMTALLELLKDPDPEMKAKLRLALLT